MRRPLARRIPPKLSLSELVAMAGPHSHRQRSINVSAWVGPRSNAVGETKASIPRDAVHRRTHADLELEASLKCRPSAKAVIRRQRISSS
jgi:hypothetical protein